MENETLPLLERAIDAVLNFIAAGVFFVVVYLWILILFAVFGQ